MKYRFLQFVFLFLLCVSIPKTSTAQITVVDSVAHFYNDDLDSLKHYLRQGYYIDYTVFPDFGDEPMTALAKRVMKIPRDKLISFDCADCALEELPKQFSKFNNLKKVSMSCSRELVVRHKPLIFKEVFELKGLKELMLYGYTFDDIPPIKSKELEYLRINYSHLKVFPKSVLELTKLQVLWLETCQFETIPDEIRNLKALKELWLEGDEFSSDSTIITKIPEVIGELQNLEKFVLGYANVQTLPKSLFDLPNLYQIYLEKVGIEYFPEDMLYNETLKYFTLFAGNNFQGFPPAIKDFVLDDFSVFIISPSLSYLKRRPLLFEMRTIVDTYTEIVESHDAAYGSDFEYETPEFFGIWEVFESSTDTLELQLLPEINALTAKLFICRKDEPFISSEHFDDFGPFTSFILDLGLNHLYKENDLFFGEVRGSIAVIFEHKYKNYPVYFHAEIDKVTNEMTITNSIGDVYKLKKIHE